LAEVTSLCGQVSIAATRCKIFGYLPVCVEKSISEVHFPALVNGSVTVTTSCSAGMPFLALPIATSPRCRDLREVSWLLAPEVKIFLPPFRVVQLGR
jgi:hypothetical protein